LDAVVVGAGTGATICGLSRYFRNDVQICLADIPGSGLANYVNHGVCWDPSESVSLPGSRRSWVDGIGQNRLTDLFRSATISCAEVVDDDASRAMVSWMSQHENIKIGPSSAVNLCAAQQLAPKLRRPQGSKVNIVVILHDSATLYPSCSALIGGAPT